MDEARGFDGSFGNWESDLLWQLFLNYVIGEQIETYVTRASGIADFMMNFCEPLVF